MRLAFIVLLAGAAVTAGGSNQGEARDAPFQVVWSSGTDLRVDIGSDRTRAQSLRRATVLTESGAVSAALVRVRRTCEWLCGEGDREGRECHYEAVLRASKEAGKPVAVFAGDRTIANLSQLPVGPPGPIVSEQHWLEAAPLESPWSEQFRWERFDDGVYLTSRSGGRDFYAPPIALAGCDQRSIGPFTRLSCMDAEFLYEGHQAVAVSFSDDGNAAVAPSLGFHLDGKESVLVRIGLKGGEFVGVLVREGGRWRLDLRGADYALIC